MARNRKQNTGNRQSRLTDEPTTQIVVVADYENPAQVIDALVRSVVRLAVKYIEGAHHVRKYGTKEDLTNLHPLNPDCTGKEIDACKYINGELFVNALLVEIFARCGYEQLMLDKKKRPYAANLIGKLYNRMFALQSITKDRVTKLKMIMHYINNTLIMEDDSSFTKRMNTSFIPSYLDRCDNADVPCVRADGLARMYSNKSTSTLIKFLVMVCQHIMRPQSAGVHYKVALRSVPDLLRIIRKQVTKKDDGPIQLDSQKYEYTPATTAGTSLSGKHTKDDEDDEEENTDSSGLDVQIDVGDSLYALIADDASTGDTIIVSASAGPVSCTQTTESATVGDTTVVKTYTIKESTIESEVDNPRNGKNLVDRVMRLLIEKELYFSLDDFNRIRVWAQKNVHAQVKDQLAEVESKAAELRKKYYD